MTEVAKASTAPIIVWLRRDLRLADNGALAAAVRSGRKVVPVFVHDPANECPWPTGGAGRWWLHHSLAALGRALAERGVGLILRRGDSVEILREIAAETGAVAVHANRCYQPLGMSLGARISTAMQAQGLAFQSFPGTLLVEPMTMSNQDGEPYKVFTPFWRTLKEDLRLEAPLPAPDRVRGLEVPPASEDLDDWGLLQRRPDWAGGLAATWTPGETGARARLAEFLDKGLPDYRHERNRPDRPGTSRLSPHLHWGEITPRQVWLAIDQHARASGGRLDDDADAFQRELGWREFSHHQLYHWPNLAETSWRPAFENFPWSGAEEKIRAWRRGMTGYPIVDAGMRELWATGWMHNRVRMIVASFLVKDLMVPWQTGEAWFWDTLVDANVAQNAANWQWIAGSGADAAPYFRIFNPVLQAEKFDPSARYVRTWVPEIARLPDAFIHKPWAAPAEALAAAQIVLGDTYPKPIVDHAEAREAALAAYAQIRASAEPVEPRRRSGA
jgi:deoxyribodipyrimidine photo-lyase